MTRHTRVRQLHKFRGTKSSFVQNEPIKSASGFYRGLGELDDSFHTVTLINLKHTYKKTLVGNYRLQKKLQKIKKKHNGQVPTLWHILDQAKNRLKAFKEHKYYLYEDGEGRFYTYELGRNTVYGFIDDYEKNTCTYYDKTGNKLRG